MRAADSLKAAPAAEAAAPVRGPAQVVDTATLRVGGATVRLAGVTGAGVPGRPSPCRARRPRGGLRPGRGRRVSLYARQRGSGVDLVGGGFARAAPDAPQPLRDAERQARADRRGLWGP